jgi:pyruvate dehydrogenase complex dehydrogenase (E1) component
MEEGFRLMQREEGESVYLRLTTRTIRQAERNGEGWKDGAVKGGYWLREPAPGAEAAIVYSGAIAPEALAAWEALKEDVPASACSRSPRPISSTAAGAPAAPDAGTGRAPPLRT